MSFEALLKDVKKHFSKDNPDICHDPTKKYEVIPTDVYGFDLCTGLGGLPRGRIIEVVAMESTGKSSLLYHMMGKMQAKGMCSILFDAEQSFDAFYAKNVFNLVEDGKTFIVFQPTCIEEVDSLMDMVIKSGVKADLWAYDSIESMKPRALIEGSLLKEARMCAHAAAMGKFVPKIKTAAFRDNCVALFTNQLRSQIAPNAYTSMKGVATGYDPKGQYTTPGGMSIRFLASMRFELKYEAKEEESGPVDALSEELGLDKGTNLIKVIGLKNKCARPSVKCTIHYNHHSSNQVGGWDRSKDLLRLLKKIGRVKQASTKFTYKGLNENFENSGSKMASEEMFANNPKLMKDAEDLIASMRAGETLLDRASKDDITPGVMDSQEDTSNITIVPMD